MGFDYATFSDHVVIPTDIAAKYPYSASGEFPSRHPRRAARAADRDGLVAAKTTRLRLVTSVMVVPHRPAVLTAKILSTIDVLSGGRLTLGIGAGWLQEEFEAIDAPDFDARGNGDRRIRARLQGALDQGRAELRRQVRPLRQHRFRAEAGAEAASADLGRRRERPGAAAQRALGDAWYPIGTNPSFPLDSLARYRAGISKLHGLLKAAGRDPAGVALAYRVQKYGPEVPARAGDGERRMFSGSPAEIAGDLRDMRALGVAAIDFSFPGATAAEALDAMKSFRDTVLAKV